mmetsp:Transcript_75182/g.224122  ORF Transcript_75182/g.224122 Transcript_75182/m.224122 type:complete len:342 (-) Transcript_75182:6-1031(-)
MGLLLHSLLDLPLALLDLAQHLCALLLLQDLPPALDECVDLLDGPSQPTPEEGSEGEIDEYLRDAPGPRLLGSLIVQPTGGEADNHDKLDEVVQRWTGQVLQRAADLLADAEGVVDLALGAHQLALGVPQHAEEDVLPRSIPGLAGVDEEHVERETDGVPSGHQHHEALEAEELANHQGGREGLAHGREGELEGLDGAVGHEGFERHDVGRREGPVRPGHDLRVVLAVGHQELRHLDAGGEGVRQEEHGEDHGGQQPRPRELRELLALRAPEVPPGGRPLLGHERTQERGGREEGVLPSHALPVVGHLRADDRAAVRAVVRDLVDRGEVHHAVRVVGHGAV